MSAAQSNDVPRGQVSSINGWNAAYLDEEFNRYKTDPGSVSPDLRAFFQGFELGADGRDTGPRVANASVFAAGVVSLINAYRELGHFAARLDPFGRPRPRPQGLDLSSHGLSEPDLDRLVETSVSGLESQISLRELVAFLEGRYCGTSTAEFMHIGNAQERAWFIANFERGASAREFTRGEKGHILEQLVRAEKFERFIHTRYMGEKRFSLEGAESLIPLVNHMLEHASTRDVEEVVMGMAHRGRLNVLNNVLGKTYEQIFTEFEDNWDADFADGGGDVKYHRGYSGHRTFRNGKTVHLAMASNPSHLESVNPVVMGRARAKQRLRSDTDRRRVATMLIHGDAAIAGQGVVAECLNMSRLDGYTVGGTIHVVVNNLIGFTTIPEDGRSSHYCTDVGKMIEAPIFHVNAEDPEAVVAIARLAVEYRQTFGKDVLIDMWCYRRYGHNESDEASYTQPILAELIRQKSSVLQVYAERLLNEGVISQQDVDTIGERLSQALDAAQAAVKQKPFDPTIDPGSKRWQGIAGKHTFDPVSTAVSREAIEEVCAGLGRVPEGFRINPKLKSLLKSRAGLLETGNLNHADAEMLAFGTLLLEGTLVRLSGQDCRRGTFSQRHAMFRDYETGEPYVSLNNMREIGLHGTETAPGTAGGDGRPRQARFNVYDSPLSEFAVVGFEYGYSLADPNMLVLWEGQFGDFVNGAQTIIDQYIASAELKWERWSGLVMLLPHGYEGAGPEHSSARVERFLELCAHNNLLVCHPTTAAQHFHMLRRQVKQPFRKPLIVLTPKGNLRKETSNISELMDGRFHEVLDDPAFAQAKGGDLAGVSRIVVCSGKVYHELAERRDAKQRRDIAIVRLEQLYPFHTAAISAILERYPKSAQAVWVQEEPRNQGPYMFIADQFRTRLGIELPFIGRDASSSPAVGSKTAHKAQQEAILSAAIDKHGQQTSESGNTRVVGSTGGRKAVKASA